MRKEEDVFESAVARIDVGLVPENIEPGGCEFSRFKRRDQRIVVNDIAAGRIDDDGALREAWR